MDPVEQELAQASKENRQPRCPRCGQPLEIEENFYRCIAFKWDEQTRRYYKVTIDEGTERPTCRACGQEFRLFIGESKVQRDLGLYY